MTSNKITSIKHIYEWHQIGTCYANEQFEFVYINIPKNASTWTKQKLESLNFIEQNIHDYEVFPKKVVIGIREPIDRWVSGISEYFAKCHPALSPNDISRPMLDIIFEKVVFDPHTEKQALFLHGVEFNTIIAIKCDNNYSLNFSNFLKLQNITNDFQNEPYINSSKVDILRTSWSNFFKLQIRNNTKFYNRIKQYYSNDYDLAKRLGLKNEMR